LASVTVTFADPSSPSVEDTRNCAKLCFTTRAAYMFPPNDAACVPKRSTAPELNTQSNKNSGVGAVSCSFN
jgi:hypothetical protein